MVQRHPLICWPAAAAALLAVLLSTAGGTAQAQAAADASVLSVAEGRAAVRQALKDLVGVSGAVNRAYEPYRRRVPADPAAWAGVADLLAAADAVAASADSLHARVDELRAAEGFRAAVRPWELRRRLAVVDSLAAATRTLAAQRNWRDRLPEDRDEARLRLRGLIVEAKTVADRTAAAAADLAYAVDVTEGIDARALSLCLVGVLVVFSVLSLIAAVVGSIRRLDDGWQRQERERTAQAVHREPTIDATTVVLIAAACATVIQGRHRVRRIRRLLSPATKRTPWSAQGRLILQGSHTVGRKHN